MVMASRMPQTTRPNDPNPDKTGTDGDGLSDVCDTNAYPRPVGGIIVPVSRLGLLASWLGLTGVGELAVLFWKSKSDKTSHEN